ncbi:MAG: methionine--tRNA ligase [Chitinophagales bacterium]
MSYFCSWNKRKDMTSNPKRYLITAALPYANGPLHIGHLAGAYIPSDIYVRYLRLKGADVCFVCGSDENGAAITLRAKKEGITPQDIVDRYHPVIRDSFAKFGINFDVYHRTSAQLHHETSQEIFKNLYDKGIFNEKTSEQYYDEDFKQFLADRYIKGTCPKCEHEDAYGDQCEKCGSALSPTELINPKSTLSDSTPVLKETTHWYLPMNEFQDWVKNWIEEAQGTESWKKHVLGQCRSWVEGGLHERSMTRDLDWGVQVPLEGADGKVLYVWLDAPIGYISATKALRDDWKDYWQDEDTKLVHFIGKDNIVFHCIIFPIILHATGGYVLPTNVPANQFLNLEGDKLSTSRNWAVWLHEYLADFPGQEDVLRYVLTVNMPETKDSEFTWQDFKDRNNKELVGLLGNFVNRALVLLHKYFDGVVPAINSVVEGADEIDRLLEKTPKKLDGFIHQYEFRKALDAVMNLAAVGNKFLQDHEPWRLIKTDKEKTAAVLAHSLKLVTWLSVYLEPFLPHSAPKIQALLSLTGAQRLDVLAGKYPIEAGHITAKPSLLFPKIDDKTIEAQVEKLRQNKALKEAEAKAAAPIEYTPLKDTIQFDDFAKLDIRTGTILEAEKVKKTKKLLKLKVTIGLEERTVVSGIAEHYAPEDIIGQKVLLLANLAPRKLRGIESQGMILMATNADGKLVFAGAGEEGGSGSVVS